MIALKYRGRVDAKSPACMPLSTSKLERYGTAVYSSHAGFLHQQYVGVYRVKGIQGLGSGRGFRVVSLIDPKILQSLL